MDVWSLEELRNVNYHNVNIKEIEFLYGVFGGRVREFLGGDMHADAVSDYIDDLALWYFGSDMKHDYPVTWNRAMNSVRSCIQGSKGLTSRDELAIETSMFWVIHSNDKDKVGFSSVFLKLLAGNMRNKVDARLWEALRELMGATGEGLMFESIGHLKLTQSTEAFQAKKLLKGGRKLLTMKFNVPTTLIRSVDDLVGVQAKRYLLPLFGNFGLIDSAVKDVEVINAATNTHINALIQFTVSKVHGHEDDRDKWNILRNNLGGARKNDKLIFIVPARNIGKFSYKGVPDDLECYIMTYEDLSSLNVTNGNKRKWST